MVAKINYKQKRRAIFLWSDTFLTVVPARNLILDKPDTQFDNMLLLTEREVHTRKYLF